MAIARWVFVLAVAAGGWLRLADLEIRPLHHDEGVNALFLLELARDGQYAYDPSNYHGPLMYYMVAPLLRFLGETTFLLRLWPAILGTATIALFWPLRRMIGHWGAAAAAWLLALSPIAVYFSRDLIHESWFSAAGMLLLVAGVRHVETRHTSWIVCGWIALAALIATKETAPLVVFAVAVGALVWGLSAHGRSLPRVVWLHVRATREAHAWGLIAASVILFLLFTSFLHNWNGLGDNGFIDMFRAYDIWHDTGTGASGHEKPWPYLFEILWRYERPAWVLAVVGLVVALVVRDSAAGLGVAALTLLTAHAAIPYKTPWLVLAVLPWIAAAAGHLIDRAQRASSSPVGKVMVLALFAGFLPRLGHDAWRVSFVDHDSDREAFVYSQTQRGFLDLVRSLRAAVLASPEGRDRPVDVMSAEHFPLNWYLRDLRDIGYWGSVDRPPRGGPVVVQRRDLEQLHRMIGTPYHARSFPLRPGAELVLALPAELFEAARLELIEPGRWFELGPAELLSSVPTTELPTQLSAGLNAWAYPDADFFIRPRLIRSGRSVHVDYDGGENDEWTPPYGLKWNGLLRAAKAGAYRFALISDDGSSLEIDGHLVVDNWGEHAEERRDGVILLDEGFHEVEVRYSDFGGGAKLRWLWTPPGQTEELVPVEVLSHVP